MATITFGVSVNGKNTRSGADHGEATVFADTHGTGSPHMSVSVDNTQITSLNQLRAALAAILKQAESGVGGLK